MIEFMVIALPRSGTAWVSNLLTTDTTLCIHDATAQYTLPDLDNFQTKKILGVADTGLALLPDWVNAHPARKIVIVRDHDEINQSLINAGMPTLNPEHSTKLMNIKADHIQFKDLFNPSYAASVYEYLTQQPFDSERFNLLTKLNVQTTAGNEEPNWDVFRDFVSRISEVEQKIF